MNPRLGCWSCHHYRRDGCEAERTTEWRSNAGQACVAFDYEPGSDEQERPEPGQTEPPHAG